MKTKVFLLSVCLGSAAAQPAQIYTDQPFSVVNSILSAGQTVYHVSISTAKF